MNAKFLALSAAASLLAATAAHAATDREIEQFVEAAQAQAQASLNTCGVDVAGKPVVITGYIDPFGKLKSVRLVETTGSPASDATVTQAIRKLQLHNVPPQLIEAKLTFHLRQGGDFQAQ